MLTRPADQAKTKAQLLTELNELRQRVAHLEAAAAPLNPAEERYRSVVTAMAEGVVVQQRSGEIVACNPAAEQILGLTQEQMMGRTSLDPRWRTIHEDGTAFPGERYPAMVTLRTGQAQRNVVMGVHKPDGRLTWILINAEPMVQPGAGEPYAVVATFTDMTHQRQTEESLRQSEEMYRVIFDNEIYAIGIFDLETRCLLDLNEALIGLYGYSRAELLSGMTVFELTAETQTVTETTFTEAIQAGTLFIPLRHHRKKDGTIFPVELVAKFHQWQGRRVMYVMIHDITERKQTEQALRDSEARFRAVLANNAVVVFDHDQALRYTKIYNPNPNFTVEGVVGKTDADLFLPADAAQLTKIKRRVLATGVGERHEVPTTLGGEVFYYDLTVEPKYNAMGQVVGLSCAAMNITESKRGEERLRESEQKYRQLVELAQEGIWQIDVAANTTYANPRMAEMLGYTVEEMRGRHLFSFMDEQGVKLAQRNLERRQQGITEQHDFEFIRQDGQQIYTMISTSPITDEAGHYIGAVALVADITTRKQAEKALAESEQKLRQVSEQSNDAIILTDETGCLSNWNPAAERIIGLPQSEALGQSLWDALFRVLPPELQTPERYEQLKSQWLTYFQIGQHPSLNQTLNLEIQHPDGTHRLVETSRFSIKTERGYLLSAVIRDVTEQKRMEAQLRESEARFKAVFDWAGVGIALIDPNGPRLQCNPALQQMLGYSAEELSEITPLTITHPDDRALTKAWMADLLGDRLDSTRMEKRYLHKNGQIVWVDLTITPIRIGQDQPVAFIGAMVDITERKQAEAALVENEQKYHRLFSEMSNGCALHEIICDGEGRPMDYITLEVNPAYEGFLNLKSEDAIGKKVSELLPPAELNHWLEIFGPVALMGQSTPYEMYSPFNQKYFEGSAYCPQKGQFAVTFTDITERRRLEVALRESEERLKMVVENSRDGINLLDLGTGKYIFMSPSQVALTGFTAEEMNNFPVEEAYARLHPDDRAISVGQQQQIAAGQTPPPTEYRWKVKNGEYRWFSDNRGLIRDAQGNPIAMVGISRDITERKRAEATLAESEARYRSLFQNNLDAVSLSTPDGRILEVNPAACAMYGYTVAEFCQLGRADLVDTTDPRWSLAMAERARTGKFVGELTHLRRDGTPFPVEVSSAAFPDQNGDLKTYVIVRDVTERKQAEAALRASEARFKTVFQASPIAISMIRLNDGRFMDVNPAWETLSGFSREETIGRTTLELKLPVNLDEREGVLRQLREQGGVQNVEVQIRSKSGAVLDVLASAEVIEIAGERCVLRLIQDITQRKRIEEALWASEQKLRQIIERSADAVILIDETGHIAEWNPMAEQGTGLSRAGVMGRLSWEVYFDLLPTERRTPDTCYFIEASARSFLETGQPIGLNWLSEIEIQRPDGNFRDIQKSDFSIPTELGFLIGSIARDITEAKQTERVETAQLAVSRVLAESPEPAAALRQILAAISERLGWQAAYLWWLDRSGSRLVWRDGWCVPDQPELAEFVQAGQGYTFEPGEGLTGTVWQTGRAIWDQDLRLVKGASTVLAVELHSATGIPIIKDGETVGVMAFFSRSARPLEERLLTALTDLGRQIGQFLARKEVEESLRRYEQMVSTSPDLLSLVDRNYVYRIINQTYLTLNNKTHDQIVDHPVAEVLGETAFAEVIKPQIDQGLAGEKIQYQAWFDFSAGGQRFLDVTYNPYREKGGTISGVVVSGRDMTEAKLLEEHLQQMQKMGAIGQLAAGMAHHFNNMLTSIIGFTSLTLHRLPPDDPQTKNLTQVLQTAERMAVLVRQLLAFAQKQLLQFKTTPLNELVLQLQSELEQLIPASVELTLHLAPEMGQVKVDPCQFEYLLRALVSNACDAMPQGGRLTLTTTNVSLGAVEAGWYELTPGDYVLLTVKDTGIGLTDEVKAHLFEPFFTTKEVGRGTGLGLAMSLGIAKQHGGHLLAGSELGQGVTFMLYLPCLAPPPPVLPSVRPASAQTILLIEAEPIVREFTVEVLTDQGYTVLNAANDEAAWQLMADQLEVSLHLLLAPARPNSPALIEQIKVHSPGLKVLFLIDEVADLSLELKGTKADFLLKPYGLSSLIQKVRAVLETAPE